MSLLTSTILVATTMVVNEAKGDSIIVPFPSSLGVSEETAMKQGSSVARQWSNDASNTLEGIKTIIAALNGEEEIDRLSNESINPLALPIARLFSEYSNVPFKIPPVTSVIGPLSGLSVVGENYSPLQYQSPEFVFMSYRSGFRFSLQGSILRARFDLGGLSYSAGDVYYMVGEWRNFLVGKVFFGRGIRVPYVHTGIDFLWLHHHWFINNDAKTKNEKTAMRLYGTEYSTQVLSIQSASSASKLFSSMYKDIRSEFSKLEREKKFTSDVPIAIELNGFYARSLRRVGNAVSQ